MKKILIYSGIFALFILFACSDIAFSNTKNTTSLEETTNSEYIPIPKHLSKQYKKEMEQIIKNGYPQAVKNADNYVKDIENYFNDMMKNGYNENSYMNITKILEICIPASEIDLYKDLMKVTQEKYLKQKYEPIGTDNTLPYAQYLYPYFRDNNVNYKKLVDIGDYESKQIDIILKKLKKVKK